MEFKKIMNRKVFIISGPPGAGKSSLANSIAQLFNKSVHIECDSLYNMVQGGHKKPWEEGADVLLALMYKVLASQAVIYLQAGFVVITDYVWSPAEICSISEQIGDSNLFYPIFLLPEKDVNLERDLNRKYVVGTDRVAKYWEEFSKLKLKFPIIFYDNSNISTDEMAQNIIKEKGTSSGELNRLLNA